MVMTRGSRMALAVMVSLILLGWGVPASAQESWRFVFTPQVWLSNIPHNGFASSSSAGHIGGGFFDVEDLDRRGPDPTSLWFPQWGGQFAAQYGRYTFGVGVQYASFEHSTDLLGSPQQVFTGKSVGLRNLQIPLSCAALAGTGFFECGQKVNTEVVRTDRIDIDLTATYFFPEVLPRLMDINTGVGFKWVRASGHRTFVDNDQFFAFDYCLKQLTPGGDTCRLINKANFLDNIYALTIPTTLNFHMPFLNGKLFLPFTATPLVGWEQRTDQVFGYDTSLAYGGTLDAGLRYVFDNGVAVYAGYRGQAIIGIDRYVAHGPLFNMSIPFGGK